MENLTYRQLLHYLSILVNISVISSSIQGYMAVKGLILFYPFVYYMYVHL